MGFIGFSRKQRRRVDKVLNEKFIDVALPDLTPRRRDTASPGRVTPVRAVR
jgi:hypothetical protein